MIFILRYKFVLFEKFVVNLIYFMFFVKIALRKSAPGGAAAGAGLWRKATPRKYSSSRVPRFAN
jgi:hypothetical protein